MKSDLSIEEIFRGFRPRPVSSHTGRWVSKCVFTHNHEDGSGRKSLHFDTEEGWYHCFSCKESGNIANLLSMMGVSAYDILDIITPNFDIPDATPKNKSEEYVAILPIKPATHYLERGYPDSVLKHFKIGEHVVNGEVQTVIPFISINKVWGIEYFTIKDGVKNRATNDGLEKSHRLYNFTEDLEEAFLVEGVADVMTLFMYGEPVIATFGTNLSFDHIQQIKKSKITKIIVASDNDLAGMLARELWYRQLKNHVEVLFIPYPSEDPGSCSLDEWERAKEEICDYAFYSYAMYEEYGETYEDIVSRAEKLFKKYEEKHLL